MKGAMELAFATVPVTWAAGLQSPEIIAGALALADEYHIDKPAAEHKLSKDEVAAVFSNIASRYPNLTGDALTKIKEALEGSSAASVGDLQNIADEIAATASNEQQGDFTQLRMRAEQMAAELHEITQVQEKIANIFKDHLTEEEARKYAEIKKHEDAAKSPEEHLAAAQEHLAEDKKVAKRLQASSNPAEQDAGNKAVPEVSKEEKAVAAYAADVKVQKNQSQERNDGQTQASNEGIAIPEQKKVNTAAAAANPQFADLLSALPKSHNLQVAEASTMPQSASATPAQAIPAPTSAIVHG